MPVLPCLGWRSHKSMPVLPCLGWCSHKSMPVLPCLGWRKHKSMPASSVFILSEIAFLMVSRSMVVVVRCCKGAKSFSKAQENAPFFFSLGLYCGLDGFVEYDKTEGREVFFVARGAVIEKK